MNPDEDEIDEWYEPLHDDCPYCGTDYTSDDEDDE